MKIKSSIKQLKFVIAVLALIFAAGCGNSDEIGIGPVESVKLDPGLNEALANTGKTIFEQKCVSCHKFDEKLVGPPLAGVTKKRKPEWIMNMILNPVEMTQKNPAAQELFRQYLVQMTFQDVTQDDARALLEYLRSHDK